MAGKHSAVFWMKIWIHTLAMTSIVNRALAAPVETSPPWETPCVGEPDSKQLLPAFNTTSSSVTSPLTVGDLRIPLHELLEALTVHRTEIVRLIDDGKIIKQLDNVQDKMDSFPDPRPKGSALTTQISTLLKEDYEKLSKIFIFLEEAGKRRTSLTQSKDKLLEVLCKMVAMGTPVPSKLTRDLAPNRGNLHRAKQDRHDYVLIKNTIGVVDSLITEYNSLLAMP